MFALEQMALAQQTMFRAARIESGFFTNCLDNYINANDVPISPMSPVLTADIRITRDQNRNYASPTVLDRMVKQGNSFALLMRYKAQAERHYRRAVEDFNRLKPCATNYQTKPFRTSNPKKTSRITCHRANPFSVSNRTRSLRPPNPTPENPDQEIKPAAKQSRPVGSALQGCRRPSERRLERAGAS